MSSSTLSKLVEAITDSSLSTAQKEQAILAKLTSSNTENKDDFLDQTKLCGPAISGDKCISLLEKCINGSDLSGCGAEWNTLGWTSGLDANNMDYGATLQLAKKLGLDIKSVEDVIKSFPEEGRNLHDTVKHAFAVIKEKINPQSVTATGSTGVPKRKPVYSIVGGMVGGGNNSSYSNYVQLMNAIKVNNMIGGGNSAAALKVSFEQLQRLLKSQGKEIETSDAARVQDLIASLARSEDRAAKAASYISILNAALNQAKITKSDLGTGGNVALKVLETLAEREKSSLQAASKKSTSILDLLKTVEDIAGIRSDIAGIKSDIAALKPSATVATSA
jgi:hypothetical protein